jgi:osmotically inducible lipoprotein OsmB
MKTTTPYLMACGLILVGLTGCNANPSKQDIGTVTGAVVGGVVGASVTGGTTWGTVAGAAAGGVIGNKIGKDLERKPR